MRNIIAIITFILLAGCVDGENSDTLSLGIPRPIGDDRQDNLLIQFAALEASGKPYFLLLESRAYHIFKDRIIADHKSFMQFSHSISGIATAASTFDQKNPAASIEAARQMVLGRDTTAPDNGPILFLYQKGRSYQRPDSMLITGNPSEACISLLLGEVAKAVINNRSDASLGVGTRSSLARCHFTKSMSVIEFIEKASLLFSEI